MSTRGLIVEHGTAGWMPRLRCQRCGRLIERLSEGGVVWAREHGREAADAMIVCKAHRPGEAACLSAPEVRPLPWLALDRFLGLLLWNLGTRGRRDLEALLRRSEPIGL